MSFGKFYSDLDPIFEKLKLQVTEVQMLPAYPLAEAYRGCDPTLGNRYVQVHQTISANALRGAPNLSDLTLALEEEGYLVTTITGSATPHNGPLLSLLHWPNIVEFHGLQHGIIESNVVIGLVTFMKKPELESVK